MSDTATREGKTQSQFNRALEELRSWIVDGKVSPNQHLIEVELAESLDVSRTTIRAVLLDLNKEGFVTLQQNRGARVRSFSREEAHEILVARERLEGIAASLAAERISDDEIVELEAVLHKMAEADAAPEPADHAEQTRRFHALIVQAAKNRTIAKFIEQTRYQLVVRQFWNLEIVHPRPESLDEHRAILVALKAGDGDAAELMMRLHVSAARDALKLEMSEDAVQAN